jgi:hypothetical protein
MPLTLLVMICINFIIQEIMPLCLFMSLIGGVTNYCNASNKSPVLSKYLQDGASDEEERVFSLFNIRATHHFTGMCVLFG